MIEDNKENNENREHYTQSSVTGAWSTIVFMIVATVAMFLIAKFIGN